MDQTIGLRVLPGEMASMYCQMFAISITICAQISEKLKIYDSPVLFVL